MLLGALGRAIAIYIPSCTLLRAVQSCETRVLR